MAAIDIHSHIIDRSYMQGLVDLLGLDVQKNDETRQIFLRRGPTTYMWYREEMFDIAGRVKRMDQQGVEMRVLSLSSPHVYDWPAAEQIKLSRFLNDETARMMRDYPGRFQAFATVPLGDVKAALTELARALDELGMVGVMVGSNIGGKPLDHPELEPFWAEINRRRLPVFEHPMLPLGAEHMDAYELPIRVGFVYETTTAMTRLIYGGVFERYSDFPFIIAHTGGALLPLLQRLDNGYHLFPDCRAHISKMPSEYAKRLYFDTCSFYPPMIKMACDLVGTDHVLWGSDEPMLGADPAEMDKLAVTPAEKKMILEDNARRILKLK